MKNKISIYTLAYIFTLFSSSIAFSDTGRHNDKGIYFETGSWKEALAKAKKEDKVIFLDVYADWCGPCKSLKQYTFLDEEVGKYFNQRFISISINGESKEGSKLIEKYGLKGYPSLLLIDNKGSLVKLGTGFQSSKQILDWATRLKE